MKKKKQQKANGPLGFKPLTPLKKEYVRQKYLKDGLFHNKTNRDNVYNRN